MHELDDLWRSFCGFPQKRVIEQIVHGEGEGCVRAAIRSMRLGGISGIREGVMRGVRW